METHPYAVMHDQTAACAQNLAPCCLYIVYAVYRYTYMYMYTYMYVYMYIDIQRIQYTESMAPSFVKFCQVYHAFARAHTSVYFGPILLLLYMNIHYTPTLQNIHYTTYIPSLRVLAATTRTPKLFSAYAHTPENPVLHGIAECLLSRSAGRKWGQSLPKASLATIATRHLTLAE